MKQLDMFDNVTAMDGSQLKPTSYIINPHGLPNVDPIKVAGYWFNILEWFNEEKDPELDGEGVIRKRYKFGVHEMTGGEILEDGTSTYPGDPAQHPLLRIDRYGEVIWGYQSEVLAVVRRDGTVFKTRVD